MRSRRAALLTAALVAATAPAAADAAGPSGKPCRAGEVRIVAAGSATLRLDCRVSAGARVVQRVAGATGRRSTQITLRPRHGTLGTLDRRTGRVRYTARPGFSGTDTVIFRVRARSGVLYRARIWIRVSPAAVTAVVPTPTPGVAPVPSATPEPDATPTPSPDPTPTPDPQPQDDGLPPRLPAVPASVAFGQRNWQPTAQDTCPRAVHERFSVVGPDGKRYPGWHPPSVVDPATGASCSFGHEHGPDPRSSDLYHWAVSHFAAEGYPAFAGLPFGLAAEALNAYADATPGTAKRSEDHVGYKVDVANDVALLGPDDAPLGVTCDYLTVVHQGSHSPDALSNNAHELLYATRCDDGTELVSTTLSRFGDPGFYERSCDPAVRIATTDNGYPQGGGSRTIPDRACVDRDVLVPRGRTTSVWALYEKWASTNELRTADPGAPPIAAFDTAFGVFDPSRYGATGTQIGRTLDLCWETEPNGDRANGVDCTDATAGGSITSPYAFDDVRSPFNGTRRDVYLAGTGVKNAGGPVRWYTDPYGGNASPTAFPGAVCQLVGAADTVRSPAPKVRVFGRNRTNDAPGVHAPN